MLSLLLAATSFVAFLLLRRRDRRMLRNGVLLVASGFFAVIGIVNLAAAQFPEVQVLIVGAILLFPLGVVVLAAFLIANGVRMVRREGRSLANLLSLVAGVGLIAVTVLVALLLRSDSTIGIATLLLVLAIAGYLGVVYLVFLTYAVVYGRSTFPSAVDAIVVLGSGLVRGEVPPLLRSRLDRAIQIFTRSRAEGRTPIVIPSGGQGADEPRPEAAAMAEYLTAHGIPRELVHPEVRSRNTEENLRFSATVQEHARVTGSVLIVTNDYHVMRAAMLAREIGSDAQVIGAPTARYYVPSAFLREFVAVVVLHRVGHAVALAVVVAFWAFVVITEVIAR